MQTADVSLPRDDDSSPVQVLSVASNGTAHLTATEGGSANLALPSGSNIVRVAATAPCWIAFGDAGVTAAASDINSLLFPAGAEMFFLRDSSYTHIAARSVLGQGSVLITATRMV